MKFMEKWWILLFGSGALGAFIPALISKLRNKDTKNSDEIVNWASIIKTLNEQIKEQNEQIKELNERIEVFEKRVKSIEALNAKYSRENQRLNRAFMVAVKCTKSEICPILKDYDKGADKTDCSDCIGDESEK